MINPLWLKLAPWVIILALIGTVAVFNDRLKAAHAATEACEQARISDHARYNAAQEAAKAKNIEQVNRIENEQRAKTDAIQSRWDADRARLAQLMRDKGNSAAQGVAGNSEAIPVPDAAGGPDGTRQVCIPESDALSAAENELKLHYVQEWIREQLRIVR